ncbi:MAG: hypothetical protein IJF08_00960 [Clostridia bacterium]|nr:hypothetical protein [Clostridia bacterium]
MNKATVIITAILAVILMLNFGFLLYVGGSTVYYYTDGVMDIVYAVLVSAMGTTVALTALPLVISDFVGLRKSKKGKRDMIFSLGLFLVGILLTFYGILALLVLLLGAQLLYGIQNALGVSWEVEQMLTATLRTVNWLVAAPAALYLIVVPMIRMIFTKQRGLQYRVLLHQPMLGASLLALTVLASVVVWLQRPTGNVMKVLGFALAALAILYLIAALAGLSKAVKAVR